MKFRITEYVPLSSHCLAEDPNSEVVVRDMTEVDLGVVRIRPWCLVLHSWVVDLEGADIHSMREFDVVDFEEGCSMDCWGVIGFDRSFLVEEYMKTSRRAAERAEVVELPSL
jgi:hypothetical protein